MSPRQLIECVPNFSEGRDSEKIAQITELISAVPGVKLLNVDPGKATNRTVVTFVGSPEAVIEAAFQAIKKASEILDMSKHSGEHPRMGATDVCPLIPISNISMEETAKYAHLLAKRVGEELSIPTFTYEAAANSPERQNLATIRSGEYEGLEQKLKDPKWKPDYGPTTFNAKAGATVIGARDFLVAYNINLNTTSVRRANAIAFDLRENGRIKREGNPITGKIVRDESGQALRIPGLLKKVKAIGWFIQEYGIAQISMNLTDINTTPLHVAFDTTIERASARGLRVTGSELVGLVPKKVLIDAGKYFLKKQNRSVGIADDEIIRLAVKTLGLDELSPFNPKERIIEYLLEDSNKEKLVDLNLVEFANETASESPAPGGGSIAAYVGGLGVALGTMVANLSAHKRGWDDQWEYFSDIAAQGQEIKDELMRLVDEDTEAFNGIMAAIRLPKNTAKEKETRKLALVNATKNAIDTPLRVMRTAHKTYPLLQAMAEKGNPASVSDAGVGALCVHAAIEGALLNVLINCADFKDPDFTTASIAEAEKLLQSSNILKDEIMRVVRKVISS